MGLKNKLRKKILMKQAKKVGKQFKINESERTFCVMLTPSERWEWRDWIKQYMRGSIELDKIIPFVKKRVIDGVGVVYFANEMVKDAVTAQILEVANREENKKDVMVVFDYNEYQKMAE